MKDLLVQKSQEKWRCHKSDALFLILLLLPTSLGASENHNSKDNEKNSVQSEEEGSQKQNFNPMELYVGSHEGVSLAHEDGGQTFFSYFSKENYLGSYISDFKSQAPRKFTRILVGRAQKENVYPLTFNTYLDRERSTNTTIDVRVHRNNDGSVSLSCESNKKFMTWGDGAEKSKDFPGKQVALSSNLDNAEIPLCFEEGICPTCRYNLVVGSITDLRFNILNVTFKAPEGWEPSKPSQVSETSILNYASEPIDSTLTVSHSYETVDETNWEHAWGFEGSVTAKAGFEANALIAKAKTEVSMTAKISYNGRHGTSNTIRETQVVEDSLTVSCPARTKCYLKYTAEKIDNFNVPFTAWVEKSSDARAMEQFEQNGTWKGVNTLNFHKIFCTENLDTGHSNCPAGMGDGRMAHSGSLSGEKDIQQFIWILLVSLSFSYKASTM